MNIAEGAEAVAPRARPIHVAGRTGCSASMRPKRLSWPMLYRQFGADPATERDDNVTVQNGSARECLRELTLRSRQLGQALEYRIERGSRGEKSGALVLLPSTPAIPPLTRVP